MSKSNSWENSLLLLMFNATAVANIADNAGTSPLTNLYVSLHSADPGEGGAQNTNEVSYGAYARVAVARSGAGWTVAANAVTNAAAVVFPEASSGTVTVTHFGIGAASAGAGTLYYSGTLTAPLNVSTGIEPRFEAGELDITED